MQIDIRARNGAMVTDEIRNYAKTRFEKLSEKVTKPARLELEFKEEHNPSIAEHFVVDAVLYMKGATLRASDRSFEMKHAVHEVSDELSRQVDKFRSKRRNRKKLHRLSAKSTGIQPAA